MLSALSAEAKVARFLTNLGERFSQMGYSGRSFNLRMTRQEIGSYLVSRWKQSAALSAQ